MPSPRPDASDGIIADHTLYALAAAVIPVPMVDVAAVTAVQLDMIRALASEHEVAYDEQRGRAIVVSLVGASLPRVGASALKVLPGVGWLAGAAAQATLSGASTWAVGQVFRSHFEGRGTLEDLDPERVRRRYRHYVERGRRIARTLREREDARRESAAVDAAAALERLARLRQTGAITADEYERLKAPLVDGPQQS